MWTFSPSPLGRILLPPSLPPGFALFFTTRDFDGRLDEARARTLTHIARDRFGVEATLATCTQVHGKTVAQAGKDAAWRECDSCDALWSGGRGVALGIKVADCLPIAMLDPVHSVIANVHSGWRGAVQRIAAETLDTLERETAFDATSALAYLGPTIRACCFEVGEEVVTAFVESYGDVERHVDRTKAKPHLDMPALTIDLLRARGFRADAIFDSALCTRCDGSAFHSFRREGRGGGRNLSVLAQ